METFLLIAGLVLAMWAVEALVLLTHYWQHRFGTMLLGAFALLSVFCLSFFAGVVPLVRLSPNHTVPLLSVVVYTNVLVALLIVYVCDGSKYARRFLAVLLGGYFFVL